MKKLQAAMRDASAQRHRLERGFYRIGGAFKGCYHCGNYYWVTVGRREVKRYTSGFNVYRSYCPNDVGWTYYCWDCSSKDEAVWENAIDIGMDAILGNRDVVREKKAALRKGLKQDAEAAATAHAPTRKEEIAMLEAEVARLMALLKK